MAKKAIQSYKDFWPYYLNEHAKPATRAIHIAGTGLGITTATTLAVVSAPALAVIGGGLACGYAAAWVSHAFVEKNKPATFTYPLWSLVSDFRMFGLWTVGRLQKHVDKYVTKNNEDTADDVSIEIPEKEETSNFWDNVKSLSSSFARAIKGKKADPKKPKPDPKLHNAPKPNL